MPRLTSEVLSQRGALGISTESDTFNQDLLTMLFLKAQKNYYFKLVFFNYAIGVSIKLLTLLKTGV